ncbi:hypothetical protein PV350_18155, partial [Streptomyces sp. PA03-6a]|nr:hypothetical protein [Streptomyces sp. PA03-6a]
MPHAPPSRRPRTRKRGYFTDVDGVWAAQNICDLIAGVPAAAAAGTEVFGGRMETEGTRRVLGARRHGPNPPPGACPPVPAAAGEAVVDAAGGTAVRWRMPRPAASTTASP